WVGYQLCISLGTYFQISQAYASRDYIVVAIDSRYHGERARNLTTYRDALVSSWKKGDTMLFIFDTVWDLIKLADHLTQREDVDPSRTGIIGESLGAMHAWFGAAADTRYSVAAPIIGVQGFRWAIEHDKWQARVDSILRLYLKKQELILEKVQSIKKWWRSLVSSAVVLQPLRQEIKVLKSFKLNNSF
ncbi:uncharacterized protein LOC105171670, partial [Sesamum indicum]|uniref:Uncharacterized protein LOC105171670 n=1 Tax=Sesamum indicum TaxID=4182 RepID=A0A8M8V8U0_SESIN